MNHVYRLIWNTSLGCWMVASEHTRSRGKRSSAARGLVAAAVLALSLPVGASDALGAVIEEAIDVQQGDNDRAHAIAPLTVHREQVALFSTPLLGGSASSAAPRAANRLLQATVNDTYFGNPSLVGENSLVLGSRASVNGARSTGIGNEVVLNGGGHTVLGSKATATGGRDAVAIGINALADGTGNVAIGEAARADTVEGGGAGIHAVAIGALARAGSPGWTGAVAVGGSSVATHDAVALGYFANAQNYGALALGREAVGNGQGALAVGRYAKAQANGAIAIGEGALAPQQYAIAVGSNANAYGPWSIAMGLKANAAEGSNAIGYMAEASGRSSVGIGWVAWARGADAVAIGSAAGVVASATDSVAVGVRAKVDEGGSYAVALGADARARGARATAIGNQAHALGYSNAIGYQADANSTWSNAIGYQAKAPGASSIALGSLANSKGLQAIAIGDRSVVGDNASYGIAMGGNATVANNATHAVAIGQAAQAAGVGSVGLGTSSKAQADHSVAIGNASQASVRYAVALGRLAKAAGESSLALGNESKAEGNYTTALGHQAKAGSAWTNAIGYQSEATGSSSVALGTLSKSKASGSVAVGDRAQVDTTAASSLALGHYAAVNAGATNAVALGSNSVATAANTVSVGSATLKRKIVNLADGEVSATSTDAVTGKQLHAISGSFNGQKVVLGENAQGTGGRAIAIGASSTVNTGGGNDGIAIGGHSRAGNPGYGGAVAIGGFATADADGLALGYDAHASAGQAVALGRGSVANVANTVSVGSDTIKRKIVNVADGALSATSTETVTGKQLFATNQNVTTATNTANTAKTTADAAKVDATAALTKANLVSGLIGQVSAAGNVRLGAENTGTMLDVRNKTNANRTVSGVADGALSATSTEAVTGKQLFATNQNVTTATNTANTAKTTADAAKVEAANALDKATVVSGLIGQVSATGNVRLGAENTGTVLDVRNKANANRTVSGVADGALSATSTEAVTGKQLFATNQNVTTATNTANTAKTTADAAKVEAANALDKATVVSGLIGQAAPNGAMRLGAENTGIVLDVRNKQAGNRIVTGVADGTLDVSSSEAVNGRQLNNTNQLVTANSVGIADNRRDIGVNRDDLDTLREAFDNYVPDLSGVVQYNADRTLVDLGGAGVTGLAAGEVSATSTAAVNGAQLFDTDQRVASNSVAIGLNRDDLDTLREDFDNYAPDLSGAVQYNEDRSLVDLGGAGMTGLVAGEVSASSSDAINGAQLFGTNERVDYLEQQQRYVMVGGDEFSGPAQAGTYAVAVGSDADASAEGSTAIGAFATALGTNSVALGRGSHISVEGEDGFALGTRTRVRAAKGLAVGADSVVLETAAQSVALGNASVATDANTVSVGNTGLKRRVVNVGRGTADDDATTTVQLKEAVAAFGGGAAVDATGQVIAPTYALSGGSFTNVGDALTSLDTTLTTHQTELDTLDNRYKSLVQNDRSIRYNEDRSVVDFGGATVTGVADGRISADSSDAVNGAQLFGTNQRVGELENKQLYVKVGANEASLPAQAGNLGVAVGGNADAREEGATAVGSFATAKGRNSVALGRAAYVAVEGREGFALGTRTRVQALGGLAIGADSDVMAGADQSVALGMASVAREANTVSVGNDGLKRRIVNVGQGIKSDDATTVAQLRGTLDALGGGAGLDANGNVIGPRIALQGGEYRSYSDALTALDSNVVEGKRSLDSLDSRFQRLFQESPSANADAPGRLALGGAQGMVLGNVANGLIGQGSRDAVNGGQLWQVKQDLQGQIDALDPTGNGTPVAMQSRQAAVASDTGSTPTPEAGDAPAAPEALVKAEGDNAVAVGSEGKERAVKHVAEGRADTDAVNVRQLNDAVTRANEYTDAAVAGVNQRLDHMDKRINRMAAISSAQSAMAMNTAGLATTNRLGAGIGHSEGESALSVGYQRVLNERGSATFSLNGAFTNSGERSVGVGMGIGW